MEILYKKFILAILVLVCALPGLFITSIWYDEGISLLVASGNFNPDWPDEVLYVEEFDYMFTGIGRPNELITALRINDVHPPVYFILLSAWKYVFGSELYIIRLMSLVFGVGTALVFFNTFREQKPSLAFMGAVVLSLFSVVVYINYTARMYSLSLFFVMLSAYYAWGAVKKGITDDRLGYLSVAAMFLAVGANYLSMFVCAGLLVWMCYWLYFKSHRATIRLLIIGALTIGSWVWFMFSQLDARPEQFAGSLSLLGELWKMVVLTIQLIWFAQYELFPGVFGTLLVMCLLLSGLIAFLYRFRDDVVFYSFILALVVPSYVGIMAMDMLFEKNLSATRYLISAAPGLACWVVLGIEFIRVRWMRVVTYCALVGMLLLGVNWGNEVTKSQGGDYYKSIAESIRTTNYRSSVVILGEGHGRGNPASALYELPDDVLAVVMEQEDSVVEILSLVNEYDTIWLIPAGDNKNKAMEQSLYETLAQHRTVQTLSIPHFDYYSFTK